MNNFLSVVMALLEHLELLTADEAKKLIKEVQSSTLPDNYEAASKLVQDIFAKHEVQKISQKLGVDASK